LAVPVDLERALAEGGLGACCAAAYEDPAVRWMLGDELHPGGRALTRRALESIDLDGGDRLLDIGSGDGRSVLLAAGEYGCRAVGIEYGGRAVAEARGHASERGLQDRVEFVTGDAEALPFDDHVFDAVLTECSLCLFTDKGGALGEVRRVLRPGGRVALSDVVAEVERLPSGLRGPLGAIACVGAALAPGAHRELLESAGFEVLAEEDRSADAIAMADRIRDRLRGAKIAGLAPLVPMVGGARAALELVAEARAAITGGAIGYTLVSAARTEETPGL
jgi:arsenite methyltransferase